MSPLKVFSVGKHSSLLKGSAFCRAFAFRAKITNQPGPCPAAPAPQTELMKERMKSANISHGKGGISACPGTAAPAGAGAHALLWAPPCSAGRRVCNQLFTRHRL